MAITHSELEGHCLCGAVRFFAALPSKWVAHCHCTFCRRAHGAAFVTWAGFHSAQVRIDPTGQAPTWYASSPGAQRAFCPRCGSPMLFTSTRWPGEMHVARALINAPLDREPSEHVFYEAHVPWLDVQDGLPKQVSTSPPPARPEAQAPSSAPATTPTTLTTTPPATAVAARRGRRPAAFAVKAALALPVPPQLQLDDQKTMYAGKTIAAGDTLYLFASENAGGSGLVAVGRVLSAQAVPPRPGVPRQTPRVSLRVARTALATQALGRVQLQAFRQWHDGRPETELNFKFYRQATDKLVGLSDGAAAFLATLC